MLVQRDLQRRYSKFRLGYLWTLLEPLGMSVVLWFVFSILLGPRGLGLQPYLLFLSLAILPWWWFSKGINASTKVFAKNGGQLRVSLLPTHLWVLRVILVSMVEFLFSLPVILIALAITAFGMVALSASIVQRRAREIVLRKLYGAGRAQIAMLLGRELGSLIGIAAVLGLPLAFLALGHYQAGFVEHAPHVVSMPWLALAGVALVTLLATLRHTWSALTMRPGTVLR